MKPEEQRKDKEKNRNKKDYTEIRDEEAKKINDKFGKQQYPWKDSHKRN